MLSSANDAPYESHFFYFFSSFLFSERDLSGQRLSELFEDLSAFDKPVAAASLGQVYKARLKKGGTAGTINEKKVAFFISILVSQKYKLLMNC